MSEVITNGDPLYDRIMKAWYANKCPATVQVGNVVYRDIGVTGDGQAFVAVYQTGPFEQNYGSQSIGPRESAQALNPDGSPKGFKNE